MSHKEIASADNGHCVERAISTMRLALGYEKGLPDGWPIEEKKNGFRLAHLCGMAFPGREVKVWGESGGKYVDLPENVIYCGNTPDRNLCLDDWLFAFSYFTTHPIEKAHIVIGEYTSYGIERLCWYMAVRIRRSP